MTSADLGAAPLAVGAEAQEARGCKNLLPHCESPLEHVWAIPMRGMRSIAPICRSRFAWRPCWGEYVEKSCGSTCALPSRQRSAQLDSFYVLQELVGYRTSAWGLSSMRSRSSSALSQLWAECFCWHRRCRIIFSPYPSRSTIGASNTPKRVARHGVVLVLPRFVSKWSLRPARHATPCSKRMTRASRPTCMPSSWSCAGTPDLSSGGRSLSIRSSFFRTTSKLTTLKSASCHNQRGDAKMGQRRSRVCARASASSSGMA